MNPIKTDQIYTFKLTTGEEMVAKITSIESDRITIRTPILTVLGPQGLQMMPGLFSADLEYDVVLNTAAWVMIAECRDDVRNSWIEATTGIKPVSKKIITG